MRDGEPSRDLVTEGDEDGERVGDADAPGLLLPETERVALPLLVVVGEAVGDGEGSDDLELLGDADLEGVSVGDSDGGVEWELETEPEVEVEGEGEAVDVAVGAAVALVDEVPEGEWEGLVEGLAVGDRVS